ncbi:cell division protein FtsA [Candidatus Beckwithbacteria bacterium]|nr:cell division protein FtsA [Candidatus Beckwithbacteria bacterium]
MARGKIFAGIDVGTSKITTVIVSQDEESDKLRVVGVATVESRGIRKSQVVDIEETIEAITKSVEASERMAGFSITDAYVSISGNHIQSQNSKGVVAVSNPGEEISEDDVVRVVEAARAVSLPSSREILHVIPRDFIVDSQPGIKDPLSMTGIRLEVEAHIISGATTAMRNLAKCITEIGITVSGLVFTGLASAEAVLTETEKELGVCLVDIGAGTTSLAVYVEGALSYSAVLPVGARHITNDLAIGMRVSLEQAEKIKLALSSNEKDKLLKNPDESTDILDPIKLGVGDELNKPSYKTMVEGIIRPRLTEIFSMVGDELKKAGYQAATPAGVVLAGGGALTVGIDQACKRTLAMPVRIGVLDGSQKTKTQLSGLIDDISTPVFATTQGLIMYAQNNAISGMGGRMSMPSFGNIIEKFPGKGLAHKAMDFIKSFLP